MIKISVVINTLNEQANIKKAIKSVGDLADEVVVVDMHSDDKTESFAKASGAKVFKHERVGYVEPARNFAISKAKGEWILILDADEKLSPRLASKLKKIVQNPKADYYRIPRKNIIFGKWIKHARWWPDYNIRFFKKGFVVWNEVIHSVPMTKGDGADIRAKEKYAIIHNHYESIDQYLQRMMRYTSKYAEIKVNDGYKFAWQDLIKKPTNEFFSRYFYGKGYKDGIHGLVLSILQGFSEFVVYAKIWQANKFIEEEIASDQIISEIKRSDSDLHFWMADALIKYKGGIINRIKRKFKLP